MCRISGYQTPACTDRHLVIHIIRLMEELLRNIWLYLETYKINAMLIKSMRINFEDA